MNIPWIKKVNIQNVEVQTESTYKEERIGTITFPDRLTNENAFTLATTVPEIYFPIDFIADRASKITYKVVKGETDVTSKDLLRFVGDVNPLFTFSDLVYQAVFCYLSEGAMIGYRTVPSSYNVNGVAVANVANISRLDIIRTENIELSEKNGLSPLEISAWTQLLRSAKYLKTSGSSMPLNIDNLLINCIDATRRDDSQILSQSPLYKALRPINNLLAAYSARYNVYVNNGYAGILTKKTQGKDGLAEAVNPADKKKIQEDLNTNGLTGNRNRFGINGITSVPVEFINTLSTIKDLMPFEETLECSVKIAGVFQIPSGLVPRKDQSTFDNQAEQERQVWENAIMSVCTTFADFWTRLSMLDKVGCRVVPDYTTVSCLQANQEQTEDLTAKRLDNLMKIQSLNPEADIKKEIDVILEEYGER